MPRAAWATSFSPLSAQVRHLGEPCTPWPRVRRPHTSSRHPSCPEACSRVTKDLTSAFSPTAWSSAFSKVETSPPFLRTRRISSLLVLWMERISAPALWGFTFAFIAFPGREATTPPLASLSGMSTRCQPQPIHSAVHSFWYVWVSVLCLWSWCDRERARGKFSVAAACAFGAIPQLRGPPAFTPCPLMWHQRTCSRSPDAFAPHRVLMCLKVEEKPFQRVRPAGPPLGKSLTLRMLMPFLKPN